MPINPFIIATVDIVLQTIAYILLSAGVMSARKSNFHKHGILMRIATLLVFISLAAVMLPVFYSVITSVSLSSIMSINPNSMTILHHSLGVLTLAMALIAITSLRPCGSIRGNQKLGNVRKYMISLFAIWSLAYFFGIIVYLTLFFNFY